MIKKIPSPIQYLIIAIFLLIVIAAIIIVVATPEELASYPTPTPSVEIMPAGVSSEETEIANYAERMTQTIKIVDDAFNTIADVAEKWPALSNDDVYTLAAATVLIEKAYETIQKVNPPEPLASSYEKHLEGLQLCSDAMPMLRHGLNDSDAQLLHKGRGLIAEATALLEEGTKEMWAVVDGLQTD